MSLQHLIDLLDGEGKHFEFNSNSELILAAHTEQGMEFDVRVSEGRLDWLCASVEVPSKKKRISSPVDLFVELGEWMGNRVQVVFYQGAFLIQAHICSENAAEEMNQFLWACQRLTPLLVHIGDAGRWDQALLEMYFDPPGGSA